MRNPCRIGALLLAMACLAGPALSQSAAAKKIYGLGNLVTQKGVQKDLGLSQKQVDAVVKAAAGVNEKYKDDLAKLATLKAGERSKIETKLGNETNKAVAGILSAAQMNRLKQIYLQERGPFAFTDTDVLIQMNYTKDQQKKILANERAYQKSLGELGAIKDPAERSKKIQAVIQETITKQLAVLTPEQKKIWKELIGAPYSK